MSVVTISINRIERSFDWKNACDT